MEGILTGDQNSPCILKCVESVVQHIMKQGLDWIWKEQGIADFVVHVYAHKLIHARSRSVDLWLSMAAIGWHGIKEHRSGTGPGQLQPVRQTTDPESTDPSTRHQPLSVDGTTICPDQSVHGGGAFPEAQTSPSQQVSSLSPWHRWSRCCGCSRSTISSLKWTTISVCPTPQTLKSWISAIHMEKDNDWVMCLLMVSGVLSKLGQSLCFTTTNEDEMEAKPFCPNLIYFCLHPPSCPYAVVTYIDATLETSTNHTFPCEVFLRWQTLQYIERLFVFCFFNWIGEGLGLSMN